MLVFFKFKTYGIPGPVFTIILSFFSNRLLWVILGENSMQQYLVSATVPQRSIFGPTILLLYINDLPNVLICDIAIYVNVTSHYSKCDQASDLWQELELAS